MDHSDAWANKYSVSMVDAANGESQRWLVTGVYGSIRGDHLEDFIMELGMIRARWELPWCIGGILLRKGIELKRQGGWTCSMTLRISIS